MSRKDYQKYNAKLVKRTAAPRPAEGGVNAGAKKPVRVRKTKLIKNVKKYKS